MECASPAQITLWLASVVLELVAAKEVHGHSQPSVRRSALIAASQVCSSIPGIHDCGDAALRGWSGQETLLNLLWPALPCCLDFHRLNNVALCRAYPNNML